MQSRVALVLVLLLFVAASQSSIAQVARQSCGSQSQSDKTAENKPKGKDDVNAIGNRKMGSRGIGNWYSLEDEIRMGQEYSKVIESQVKLLEDPLVNEYVNRVGQNLVRNSDAKVPFTIKVIDSEEMNAFSLPGGFLYVNSGLVLAADSEAELAGAMAHEIAHVAARHATRQMTRSQLVSLLSIPLVFVGGPAGLAVREALSVATPLTLLKFSRTFESDADYLGVEYLYEAGYDPEAMVSFFEKIKAMEHAKPGTLNRAFASHPQTPDRVRKSQAEINCILPARTEYLLTTSDFDNIQRSLYQLEHLTHRHEKDRSGPILRRQASPSPTESPDDSQDDSDRPVLKRRSPN